jgi:hypothetical protein
MLFWVKICPKFKGEQVYPKSFSAESEFYKIDPWSAAELSFASDTSFGQVSFFERDKSAGFFRRRHLRSPRDEIRTPDAWSTADAWSTTDAWSPIPIRNVAMKPIQTRIQVLPRISDYGFKTFDAFRNSWSRFSKF